MNIFGLLMDHLGRERASLPFPRRNPPQEGYRGLLEIDHERCVGCATCVYVCSPHAIEIIEQEQTYTWTFDAAKCTFCGRCVDYCPLEALSMQPDRGSCYLEKHEAQKSRSMKYPTCSECGQPAQPVNLFVLQQVFNEISPAVLTWSRLCSDCRKKNEAARWLTNETKSAGGRT